MPTQKQRILEYLEEGRVLTRFNAWTHLGIMEAPARISELRRQLATDNREIRTTYKPIINRYGERIRVAEWSLPDARNRSAARTSVQSERNTYSYEAFAR